MKLFAFLFASTALCASTITATYTLSQGQALTQCWPADTCPPLVFTLPRFDTKQGTLDGIEFSYSGQQGEQWGYNDMYDPQIGSPWSATVTGGLSADLIPLVMQDSTIFTGTARGSGQTSNTGTVWVHTLSGSGSDSNQNDLAAFEGTGTVALSLQPFGFVRMTEANNWIFGVTTGFWEYGTLTVSYLDSPAIATPEPRWAVLAGIFALLAIKRKRRLTL